MRDDLLVQTNGDRATLGLLPLVLDLHTQSAANERAKSQLNVSVLTHLDARGDLGFVVDLQQRGVKYGLAGENLARSYSRGQNAGTFEDAWMASPLHRANILDPRFTQVAFGVADGPRGEVVLAAIFRDSIGDQSVTAMDADMAEKDGLIGQYLIRSIDENGYLAVRVEGIAFALDTAADRRADRPSTPGVLQAEDLHRHRRAHPPPARADAD